MPSPFPGMDPYLENPEIFPDFHDSFVPYLRESLLPHLPEAVFNRTYDAGPYRREIDYREAPPAPPLREERVAWAKEVTGDRRSVIGGPCPASSDL